MFITIAIPSYNRPETLSRLLNSIDFITDEMEVLICEDNSPRRSQISKIVQEFKEISRLYIRYFENEINIGYDANLWELLRKASGKYVIYMGDDDLFIEGALQKLYSFLKENPQVGYVLKSHKTLLKNGKTEIFNYYTNTRFFRPGKNTIVELFRKSVLISGFCIYKDNIIDYYTEELNGTLLVQLYMLSIIANNYPSAYLAIPLTMQVEGETVPYFGSSDREKKLYTPGSITIENSLSFMKSYIRLLGYIEKSLDIKLKHKVVKDMSKYFYPTLAIQRDKGLIKFIMYVKKLSQMGYNISFYYYLYVVFLIVFGKKICDTIILNLKKILGRTPRL